MPNWMIFAIGAVAGGVVTNMLWVWVWHRYRIDAMERERARRARDNFNFVQPREIYPSERQQR